MFPEGDVSGRDDQILPLKEDGIRNMFEAQGRLLRGDGNMPVYLLAVAAFYEVNDGAIPQLDNSIHRLGRLLGLQLTETSLEEKIGLVLAAFIEHLESYYGVNAQKELPLETRLLNICKHVALTIAQFAGVEVGTSQPENVLLYSVRGQLRRWTLHHSPKCNHCNQLTQQGIQRTQACIRDLDRIEQLLIVATTMQEKPFTLEVAWRLIDRLEQQLTGRVFAKCRRVVRFEATEPINILEFWSEYEKDKHQAVKQLERRARAAMSEALKQSKVRQV